MSERTDGRTSGRARGRTCWRAAGGESERSLLTTPLIHTMRPSVDHMPLLIKRIQEYMFLEYQKSTLLSQRVATNIRY